MKKLLITSAALFAASLLAHSTPIASSLLIQGPFGSGGAVETHKWKVYNDDINPSSGQDLLTAVFGARTDTGTTHLDPYGAPRPFWKAGNSSQGVGYLYFSEFNAFTVESFTLSSVTVTQFTIDLPPPPHYRSWSYYVAGGSGLYANPDYTEGNYPNGGTWTYSNDGLDTRELVDGSFDGWVFGAAYPDPAETIAGGGMGGPNAPLGANFSGASLVKTGPGVLTLTGSQNYPSLTVSGGTTNLATALGTGSSTITVNPNATLNITASQTLSALNIGAGAVVTFSSGPPALAGTAAFYKTAPLVPEPGATLLLMLGAAFLSLHRPMRGRLAPAR